jgi:K+-transporting ATPase KdpF subunit
VRENQTPQAIEDGAKEAGQPVSRPLSRPSPTANLAGDWKGDPLNREVRGLKFTQNKNVMACYAHASALPRTRLCWTQSISDWFLDFSWRSAFMQSAAKSSRRTFMENIILGIISLALCVYLIVAMIRPEKF